MRPRRKKAQKADIQSAAETDSCSKSATVRLELAGWGLEVKAQPALPGHPSSCSLGQLRCCQLVGAATAGLCQLLLSNKISAASKGFLLKRCHYIVEVMRLREPDAISQLGINCCNLRTPRILQTLR